MNLEPIKQAVRTAATLCREVQLRHLQGVEKAGREPVTIADYGSQALISYAISLAYPDDAIMAEEQGEQFLEVVGDDQKTEILALLTNLLDRNVSQDDIVQWINHGKNRESARTWVIDPIDGTKGFLAMRHYAIGVGILENGQIVGSVMAAPGHEDGGALFYAWDGEAYKEPLEGGKPELISVSSRSEGRDLLIVQSFEKAHASKSRMGRVRELIGALDENLDEIDSMEKYARVACGKADVYLRLPRADNPYSHRAWDHAAGVALVLAAGGRVTDVDGSLLDFSTGSLLPNKGMVVSNGVVHDRVVGAVQQVMAET